MSKEKANVCTLNLNAMDCPDCASKVEKAVAEVDGVCNVHVDFLGQKIRVEFDPERTSEKVIGNKVNDIGYRIIPEDYASVLFHVEGMCCGDESTIVKKALAGIDGVREVSFRLVSQDVRIVFDPGLVVISRLIRAIESTGMKVSVRGKEPADAKSLWMRHKGFFSAALSGVLLITGMGLQWLAGMGESGAMPLYVAAMAVGGAALARRGLIAIINMRLDMNALMTVAVIGATIIGEWLEGAMVVFLFSVAQLLESYSLDRARRSIRTLMQLSPSQAMVRRDGKENIVPVDEVGIDELIIVRPGERISLDGIITSGRSFVDQSPITGESALVEKSAGDEVFAGSINGNGALEVKTTHRASDTTLARIIHMVEEAQSQKAPSHSFVDRFALVYTPTVIVLAGLVMVLPPLLLGQPFVDWFYRALVLLVISCPCALVISTPVTVVSGLAAAASRGVLIKGGIHLENLGKVRAVALDKTGTLTLGKPRVVDVISLNQRSKNELLTIAAAIESRSEHPLAAAIVEKACEEGLPSLEVLDFRSIPGKGAIAKINGHEYAVGSHRFFDEMKFCTPQAEQVIESLEKQGQQVVVVGCEHGITGIITMADAIRSQSRTAITALREVGVERVIMLTGDNRITAQVVAEKVGVDEVSSELLPQKKMEAIQALHTRYPVVAMVGDGVNDAPALASATIGIAMGAAGTDQALETADVALMGDDLSLLAWAILLGRRALRTIKANITVAIGIKLIFLIMAVGGLATLWMAVAADMGTSLLVIFNGLRLFRESPTSSG